MTKLIEWREHIRRWYSRHDRYIILVTKFLMAVLVFWGINYNIGYMNELKHIYVVLLLAVVCAILPMQMMIFLSAALVLLHLYALSLRVAMIAAVMFLIMFLVYFRFEPKNGEYVIVTPLAFACQIPYVMPVITGLLKGPYSIISVIFGTVTYYFLSGVKINAPVLRAAATGEENVNEWAVTLNQVFGNKEMYLVLAAFVVAMIVVYNVRRMGIDHAWSIAIAAGILTQFLILVTGYLALRTKEKIVWLIIGCLLSGLISMVIEFFFFNLDYHRTERVQFEDDEYYYYVKAVPKVNLSSGEKTVQKIAGTEKREDED